jgi:hypothetical protein
MEASLDLPGMDGKSKLQCTGNTAEGDAATAVESEHLFPYLDDSLFGEVFPSRYLSKPIACDSSPLDAHGYLNDAGDVNAPHHGSNPKRRSDDRSSTSERSTFGERRKPYKKKVRSIRFSEAQTATLQSWLDSNKSNPYLNQDDKQKLSEKTGLTVRQIEAWFNRTRRRKLAPGLIKEPVGTFFPEEQAHLSPPSPLERYLSQSPDTEAVDEGAMADLISQSMLKITDTPWNTQQDSTHVPIKPHANGGYASSAHSFSSAASASSFASFGPRKGRRRHYAARSPKPPAEYDNHRDESCDSRASAFGGKASIKAKDPSPMLVQNSGRNVSQSPFSLQMKEPDKPYQCTYCFKGFRKTYEWRRHQESTHSPAEEWICLAPKLMKDESMINPCVFCQRKHSNFQEFDAHHRVSTCLEKCQADRTFFRKDHLMQHVRGTHCDKMTAEDKKKLDLPSWSLPGPSQRNTPCGFCGIALSDYDTRIRHIAKHFENGEDMTSWKAYDTLDTNLGGTSGHWSCFNLLAFAHSQYPQFPCPFCTESVGEHVPWEPDRESHWAVVHYAYTCPQIATWFVSVEEFKEHLITKHGCRAVPELAVLIYFCSGTTFMEDPFDWTRKFAL